MEFEEFSQRLSRSLAAGAVLQNPGGGTTTVIGCRDGQLRYQRGHSRFGVATESLYEAYRQFAGSTVTTATLKEWAPTVFDSARGGHNCHCTVLFLALQAMGLAGSISGAGRRGSPFAIDISVHDGRWALYIDVQGFSNRWARDHVSAVGDLMLAIARIGRRVFPNAGERLFAHQFGDGFLVVSEFHESTLDRCATVAIALMRHLAASGRFARGAIAEGEIADVVGCYPREVFEGSTDSDCVSIGHGVLTIVPVLGSALIAAAAVDRRKPRGPLLLVDETKASRLHATPVRLVLGAGLLSIDWVHADLPEVRRIQSAAGLRAPSPSEIEASLRGYCEKEAVTREWRDGARHALALES